MRKLRIFLSVIILSAIGSVTIFAINPSNNMNEKEEMSENLPGKESPVKPDNVTVPNHLLIVWTSGDPEVAHKMVFMYAYNAQKNAWWDQVTLLVWGPSSKLSSEDKEIQEALIKMKEQGVELVACKGCADQYGVSEKLEELGIEVKYTGTYLTDFIKSGKKVISF